MLRLRKGYRVKRRMNTKVRLILILAGVGIVLLLLATNVTGRLQDTSNKPSDSKPILEQADSINRAQVAKMLSLLSYSKAELSALTRTITYNDTTKEDWYDVYINGVAFMGMADAICGSDAKEYGPNRDLTYGEAKTILTTADTAITEEQLKTELPFLVEEKESRKISFEDWIQIYQYMKDRVYEKDLAAEKKVCEEELYIVATKETNDSMKEYTAITNKGEYHYDGLDMTGVVDSMLKAYVKGNEILYVESKMDQEATLHNVWITAQDGVKITAFINGIERSFEMNNPVEEDLTKQVADLTIRHEHVNQITLKPETVRGKVLVTGESTMELEGYGVIPLDPDFRVYQVYNDVKMELSSSILVGYENTKFVVSNGTICAALITEPLKAENIRVLLNNSEFTSIIHKQVVISAETPFTMTYGDQVEQCEANQLVTIDLNSPYMAAGRVVFQTNNPEDKIKVVSINRSEGTPEYRGTIEIGTAEGGLTIINELSLEEYLYAVIPSEMPRTYGVEALKVQAVCARSYAYNHLIRNTYSQYGAHVDDSTLFQVYNNHPENEESIQAVKETYGKVLQYNGEVIFAYYYSTSCGYSANASSVWLSNEAIPYLKGKYQGIDLAVTTNETKDFSNEESFRNFITTTNDETLDKEFPWYRWTTEFQAADLKKVIDSTLPSLYKKKPEYVLTMREDGKYVSKPIQSLGSIQSMQVSGRDSSGLATEITIQGETATVKVQTEGLIRELLKPIYNPLIRQDGSAIDSLKLLPSSFFVIDENRDGGTLVSIKLSGGGYGHGVGMSQNGVKKLVEMGKGYEEILKYYYDGIGIGGIY